MQFYIKRASLWNDEKPCEEATPSGIRDEESYYLHHWIVEINSLEELLAFVEKYDRIIIDSDGCWSPEERQLPVITIYDGYME